MLPPRSRNDHRTFRTPHAAHGSLSLDSLLCGLDYVRQNVDRIDTAVLAFENDGSPDGIAEGIVNVSRL